MLKRLSVAGAFLILGPLLSGQTQDPPSDPVPTASDPDLVDALLSEFSSRNEPRTEYGAADSFLSIHGFLELVYDDPAGDVSSLDAHHANLLLDIALSPTLDGRVEFEWEHGAAKTEMDQVYLDWHPWDGDGPSFLAGRFYAPFGVERRTWYPPINPAVSRPLVMTEVVPGSWYETGLMLRQDLTVGGGEARLEGAVVNGLGPTLPTGVRGARQEQDTNADKALVGRLGWSLPDAGFECGLSAAGGRYDQAGDQSYSYLGADASLDLGPVDLTGEWVRSELDDPAAPGGSRARHGWYLQALAPLAAGQDGSRLEALIRADSVEPDDDVVDASDRDALSLGLRWLPEPHLVLKLEYQFVSHDQAGAWPNGNTIYLSAVLDF
ncbi:MAG: hypothetical protein D6702_06115 [Planctomycetota bacterium]|nr:MAG: hypothetical protein D6702_06115 [Planctomycetota bacterium]